MGATIGCVRKRTTRSAQLMRARQHGGILQAEFRDERVPVVNRPGVPDGDGLRRREREQLPGLDYALNGDLVVDHRLGDPGVQAAGLREGAHLAAHGADDFLRCGLPLARHGRRCTHDGAGSHVDLVCGKRNEGAGGECAKIDEGVDRDIRVTDGGDDAFGRVHAAARRFDVQDDGARAGCLGLPDGALDERGEPELDDTADRDPVHVALADGVLSQDRRGGNEDQGQRSDEATSHIQTYLLIGAGVPRCCGPGGIQMVAPEQVGQQAILDPARGSRLGSAPRAGGRRQGTVSTPGPHRESATKPDRPGTQSAGAGAGEAAEPAFFAAPADRP
jgi:hypothetical protein